jgi:hypothetical protein
LGAATLLLLLAAWVTMDQQWITILPSFFYQTLIFLFFGTGLLFIYLYRFDKPDFFVQLYLLTMAVKLLAYGAYNFFMVLEDKMGARQNVVWFMILYFIFTVLEIGFLYRKISNN